MLVTQDSPFHIVQAPPQVATWTRPLTRNCSDCAKCLARVVNPHRPKAEGRGRTCKLNKERPQTIQLGDQIQDLLAIRWVMLSYPLCHHWNFIKLLTKSVTVKQMCIIYLLSVFLKLIMSFPTWQIPWPLNLTLCQWLPVSAVYNMWKSMQRNKRESISNYILTTFICFECV